jgi:hypothetical protein
MPLTNQELEETAQGNEHPRHRRRAVGSERWVASIPETLEVVGDVPACDLVDRQAL